MLKKIDLKSLIFLFLIVFGMNSEPALAQGKAPSATAGGTSLSQMSETFNSVRGTPFAYDPNSVKGLLSKGGTITATLTSALPGLIGGALTQFPPQASLSSIPFGSMNEGAMVLGYMNKAGIKFNGNIVEDAEYFTSNLAASDLLATEVLDPKNVAFNARAGQLASLIQIGNVFGSLSVSQSHSALDAVDSVMKNFTAERGNVWNKLRDQVFMPIALLLLLPGAVLTQVKALVDTTRGDYSDPWAGILRSIVAIFLIPASYLVVNYGIDLSNSMSICLQDAYQSVTGRNLSDDVLAKETRAFPVRTPMENQQAGLTPNLGWNVGKIGNISDLEKQLIENQPRANGLDNSIAATKTDDAMPISAATLRTAAFGANFGLTAVWNLLTAFQFAFLAFLFLMGPVICALWVYPIEFLQRGLSSWLEGVVTICFWTFFWHTGLIVVACLPDNGSTGTIAMTVGNFLMISCVKYAFDFSGLVRAAASEASSKMLKELESGNPSAKPNDGNAQGKSGGSGNTSQKSALDRNAMTGSAERKGNSVGDSIGNSFDSSDSLDNRGENGNILSASSLDSEPGVGNSLIGNIGASNLLDLSGTGSGALDWVSPKDIALPPLINQFASGDDRTLGSVTGFSSVDGRNYAVLNDGANGLQVFDYAGQSLGALNNSITSMILPGSDQDIVGSRGDARSTELNWNPDEQVLSLFSAASNSREDISFGGMQSLFSDVIPTGQRLELGGPFALTPGGLSVDGVLLNLADNSNLNFQLGDNMIAASLESGNISVLSAGLETFSTLQMNLPNSSGFTDQIAATVTTNGGSQINTELYGNGNVSQALTETSTGQTASLQMSMTPDGTVVLGGSVAQFVDAQRISMPSSLPGTENPFGESIARFSTEAGSLTDYTALAAPSVSSGQFVEAAQYAPFIQSGQLVESAQYAPSVQSGQSVGSMLDAVASAAPQYQQPVNAEFAQVPLVASAAPQYQQPVNTEEARWLSEIAQQHVSKDRSESVDAAPSVLTAAAAGSVWGWGAASAPEAAGGLPSSKIDPVSIRESSAAPRGSLHSLMRPKAPRSKCVTCRQEAGGPDGNCNSCKKQIDAFVQSQNQII